jgi:serine/threonine protein phosphatase PrpC
MSRSDKLIKQFSTELVEIVANIIKNKERTDDDIRTFYKQILKLTEEFDGKNELLIYQDKSRKIKTKIFKYLAFKFSNPSDQLVKQLNDLNIDDVDLEDKLKLLIEQILNLPDVEAEANFNIINAIESKESSIDRGEILRNYKSIGSFGTEINTKMHLKTSSVKNKIVSNQNLTENDDRIDNSPVQEEELEHSIEKNKESNDTDQIMSHSFTISSESEFTYKIFNYEDLLDINRETHTFAGFNKPYPNKDQDHVQFFELKNGSFGIIVCDGVSGEGGDSKIFAKFLPNKLIYNLNLEFDNKIDSLEVWQSMITKLVDQSVKELNMSGGASTLLFALINKSKNLLYLTWFGDGHGIYINKTLSGLSRLIFPHQDKQRRLTTAITATGIIGEPTSQITSLNGGMLILASDGYRLDSGHVLNHLLLELMKKPNTEEIPINLLQQNLLNWGNGCCEEEKFHPKPTDDQTIGVVRW